MGNEIEPIKFGGANVYNAERTEVKYDSDNKPIYCVWMKSGAYAEYPEQGQRVYESFYAKDVNSGDICKINQKIYDSGKKVKDGKEYEFFTIKESAPNLSEFLLEDSEWGKEYKQVIDGFTGLKFNGSQTTDKVYLYDITDVEVNVNNDEYHDEVYKGIGAKNVNVNFTKGKDLNYKFNGFVRGGGYINEYKF